MLRQSCLQQFTLYSKPQLQCTHDQSLQRKMSASSISCDASGTTTEFFGSCKVCDCDYMGSRNNACDCGHPYYEHISLAACGEGGCPCAAFLSCEKIPQCYTCGHGSIKHGIPSSGDKEYNYLSMLVAQGVPQKSMIKLYEEKFSRSITLRTLQRKLAELNIKAVDRDVSDEEIVKLIRAENENGVIGYHRMYTVLRTKYRKLVTRDRLHHLMRTTDGIPRGRDPKINARVYHQKPFSSKGPNWIWALDGYEKLVQPYGMPLYIYGVIDTFSRKVLALNVLPNKKKETVGSWLLSALQVLKGQPHTLMIDKGMEWRELLPKLPVIQMKSTFNQKIEALWNQLSLCSDILRFRRVFEELESSGQFNRTEEKNRWAAWLAFSPVVQKSLNEFRTTHNSHRIRKQNNVDLPTGHSPNFMYENPIIFQTEDYMEPIAADNSLPSDVNNIELESRFSISPDLRQRVSTCTKDDCVLMYTAIIEQAEPTT